MSRHRMRTHPTQSLGITESKTLPEINTVHAFGRYGNETYGWPYRSTSMIGRAVGPNLLYREPRLSQNELGGSARRRRRKKRKR